MKYLLFTTQTCPKCPEIKQYINDNVFFEGEILDNTHPKFIELAGKYDVISAPLFIVFEEESEIFRGSEVYEIEEFLKSNS